MDFDGVDSRARDDWRPRLGGPDLLSHNAALPRSRQVLSPRRIRRCRSYSHPRCKALGLLFFHDYPVQLGQPKRCSRCSARRITNFTGGDSCADLPHRPSWISRLPSHDLIHVQPLGSESAGLGPSAGSRIPKQVHRSSVAVSWLPLTS